MRKLAWPVTIVASSACLSGNAFALGLEEYLVKVGTRYDTVIEQDQRNRWQAELRVGFTLDTVGGVKLKSRIATGDSYTSRYTTLYDFLNDESSDFRLYVRQLYLERTAGDFRFQLGTIPPVKGIVSSTGLRDLGWVDGGRAEYRYGSGVIEVVAGLIDDLDNPNTFTRSKGLNFMEVELSQEVHPNVGFELSSEYLDDDGYGRGELRVDVPAEDRTLVTLIGEGLLNLRQASYAAGATADIDVLHALTGRDEKRFRLIGYYSYVEPDIGTRGELTEDFYVYGHSLTIETKGAILRDVGLQWFTKSIAAEASRFQVGMSVQLDQTTGHD